MKLSRDSLKQLIKQAQVEALYETLASCGFVRRVHPNLRRMRDEGIIVRPDHPDWKPAKQKGKR